MFVKLPKIVRLFYPNLVWKNQTATKKLWLTFDDGPHPDVTPWILSVLNTEQVKSTFFLTEGELNYLAYVHAKVSPLPFLGLMPEI